MRCNGLMRECGSEKAQSEDVLQWVGGVEVSTCCGRQMLCCNTESYPMLHLDGAYCMVIGQLDNWSIGQHSPINQLQITGL